MRVRHYNQYGQAMNLRTESLNALHRLCYDDPMSAKPLLIEYEAKFSGEGLWRALRGAMYIDTGSALCDEQLIRKGIGFEEEALKLSSTKQRAARLYNIANGYSGLFHVERASPSFQFNPDSSHQLQALRHLRAALAETDLPTAEMMVNYGNCLSSIGRWDEALVSWRKALAIDAGHPMAIGNLGVGLLHFAGIGNDARIVREAADALRAALESPRLGENAGPDAKEAFRKELQDANTWLERHPEVTRMPKLGRIKDAYVRHCFENRLILSISGRDLQDRIGLRIITDVSDDATYFRLSRVVNEIKERFATARLLEYQAAYQKSFKDADKMSFYTDILDYGVLGCRAGQLKVAFESAFNVLDKVAFFLNDYLALKVPESKVTFGGIFKGTDGKLRSELLARNNYHLFALYGVAQDFGPDGFMKLARRIRNFSTHRYLVPHEMPAGWRQELDGNDYHIDYRQLYSETLRLLQIVKSAMVYLIAFVDQNERQKKKQGGQLMNIVIPHYHPTDVTPTE
jgi:tetratricopeptide (TPR) repeat protein